MFWELYIITLSLDPFFMFKKLVFQYEVRGIQGQKN